MHRGGLTTGGAAQSVGVRVRLHIAGRVQGVFYRGSMQAEARRLGVRGWVRNCADGSVEAVVDGDPADIRSLIEWARIGPPGARVREVVEQAEPDSEALGAFHVRH